MKAQDHFDEFHPVGRNPFYKNKRMGLRHETELIVDRGIEFLQNQPSGKPCSQYWFNACHAEDGDDLVSDTSHGPERWMVCMKKTKFPPKLNDPKILIPNLTF